MPHVHSAVLFAVNYIDVALLYRHERSVQSKHRVVEK